MRSSIPTDSAPAKDPTPSARTAGRHVGSSRRDSLHNALSISPTVVLLLALLPCVLYLGAELYLLSGGLGLPLDDGWIHLQFARQLAAGDGLAYNPGEPSTGSTAPLWTALLSLAFLFPGSALVWAKVLGIAAHTATIAGTARLGTELGLPPAQRLLGASLVASSSWLVWSALSAMEIPLFAALCMWGMALHLHELKAPARRGATPPASLLLLSLACLARPEGLLLLALALAERLGRQPVLRGLALALLILVPTLCTYFWLGGSLLPSTFGVKSGPPGDLLPSGRYLRTALGALFDSQPVAVLIAGAGVLRLAEKVGRRRGLLPALWLLALPLAYSVLAPERGPLPLGNFGRYLFPLIPLVALLAVLGLQGLRARCNRSATRAGHWSWAAVLLVLLIPQVWGLSLGVGRYAQTVSNVEASDVAAARWLQGRVDPQALLAVQDIGALKFLLPNRVLDLAGIVTPEIGPVLRGESYAEQAYWEDRLLTFLGEKRPDLLIVFPASYPKLVRSPGFTPLRTFRIADNVTMAGDELVVFSTPWSRFPVAD